MAFGTVPEVEVGWPISNGHLATGTAKLLNISDPHDPVQVISGAAALMKEAPQWRRAKIADMRESKPQMANKLREGTSVYYNLSSDGRRACNGTNTGGNVD